MPKIAVIGGSYLQLPLVRKAKSMGIETHVFAWREGAICADIADYFYAISILEKEAILEQCEQIGIDGVITIASDTAVVTVNYVASHMGLVANSDKYSQVTTNKYLMRECFTMNGIPSPKFTLAYETGTYNLEGFKFPLIIKPTDRSGSRGVERIQSITQLNDAVMRAQNESFEHKAIIEEYVTGIEISVESISYKGKHFILQITDKVTTGEPYFVEIEHHQPSRLSFEIQEKVKSIVPRALTALHVEYGAGHTELKIMENGDIKIIEIGARMGGDFIGSDLVQLSTGYDFLKGVIEVSLGDFHEPQITEHNYSGVYFLSKETEHLKTIIEKPQKFSEIVEAKITDYLLRNVESSSDRSGYLIYKSKQKFIPQTL